MKNGLFKQTFSLLIMVCIVSMMIGTTSFSATLPTGGENPTLTLLTNEATCKVEYNQTQYDSGDTIEIAAETEVRLYARAGEGFEFDEAESDDVNLTVGGSLCRYFEMPSEDVTVTFNFNKLPATITGSSVYRSSDETATIKFYSDSEGTYYYYVTDDDTAPSVSEIKEASSGVYGSDDAVVGMNSIELAELSSGEQYVHILVDNGTASEILSISMPYDIYYSDNFESYAVNTYISSGSLSPISQVNNGTGNANQKVIARSDEGQCLSLSSSGSWASDQIISWSGMIPTTGVYVFEGDAKPQCSSSETNNWQLRFSFTNGSYGGNYEAGILFEDGKIWDMKKTQVIKDSYSKDNWYHFKVEVFPEISKYNIYLDGEKTSDFAVPSGINRAAISAGHGYTTLFDNLVYYADPDAEVAELVAPTTYTARISAVEMAAGEELEGAILQIVNSEGATVKEWASTTEIHAVEELSVDEEYTLKVTVAPDGYTIPTETTFVINSDGTITTTGSTTTDSSGNTVMLVEFEKTQVEILAVKASDNSPLSGVIIQIIDSDGNVIEEWQSTSENHEIEGLVTDKEYTIKVIVVPDDYVEPSGDICTFTIDETGNVTSTGTIAEGVILVGIEETTPVTTYTVNLNPNGGSVTPTSIEVEEDGTYGELPIPDPAEEGTNFLGWFKSRVLYDDNACFDDTTITNYVIRATPAADMNYHNSGVHYFNYGDVLVFNVTVPDAEILKVDLNDTYIPTSCYTISEDGHNVKGVVEITNNYDIWYVLDFIDVEITKDVDPYDYDGYTINEFSIYKTPVTAETDVENAEHSLIAGWDTVSPATETCLLQVNVGDGLGRISVVDEGQTPSFEGDPYQSHVSNIPTGTKKVLGAKAEDDYIFVNWTISEDDSFSSTEPQIEITVTEDVEYLANFKLIEYNVTYDNNGGTGTMIEETSKYYIFPNCEFTAPSGKIFDKWEVNGNTYEAGDTLTLTEDITVKAIWKTKSSGGGSSMPSSYKVTTKIENGTVTPNTITLKRNESKEFRFSANEGYEIKDVLVDNKSIGAVDSYTIEKITANHTIEVKTSKITKTDTDVNNEQANGDSISNVSDSDTQEVVNNFIDVSPSDSFYDDVNYSVKNNLFSGISKTEFGPNIKITRGMLVTVLYKFANGKEIELSDFEDVDKEEYYSAPIAWATKNGFVSGIGDNKFAPDANVTKQDLATIMYKYVKSQGKGFTGMWMFLLDATDRDEIEEYAYEPVCWFVMNNVLTTDKNKKINPTSEVTRIETVQIFRKISELLK